MRWSAARRPLMSWVKTRGEERFQGSSCNMSTRVIHAPEVEALSVLLVEDNAVDAKLITALLRSPRLECTHVSRLDAALVRLGNEHPDVVLLDLNLEDSAGYETFHRVRQATAKAAILVLSGSNDEDRAIRPGRKAAQVYFVKGWFAGRLLLGSFRY